MTRVQAARSLPRRRNQAHPKAAVLMLVLPVGLLAVLGVFPMLYSFWISLHQWYLGQPYLFPFVGLANYASVLESSVFLHTVAVTLGLTVATVALQLVLGLGMGLLLYRRDIAGLTAYRTLLILPMAVAPMVAGILWRFMLNPDYGVLAYLADRVFGGTWNPLGSTWPALGTLLATYTWEWTPFVALFLYAAMLSAPKEALEAAQIDGASDSQAVRYILLPYLRQVVTVVGVLEMVTALRMFTLVYTLTSGGPGLSTATVSYRIWQNGLNFFFMGRAAAESWIVIAIASVLATVLIRVGRFEVRAS